MDVKERLQAMMDERGWTIYRLAKEADIPWSTLRNMFKRNTEPSIFTLECICKGMGISMIQFFDYDNRMGLTDEQTELLRNWNKLDEKHKRLVNEMIEALNTKSN